MLRLFDQCGGNELLRRSVGLPQEEVMKMAENIYETTLDIFKSSREQGIQPTLRRT